MRIAAALSLIMLSLASCAHQPRAVTRMDATYLSATPHLLAVSLESAGAFSSSRQMPLGSNVRVTIEGKRSTLAKLQEGRRIRITRDLETHEVVAIDAL